MRATFLSPSAVPFVAAALLAGALPFMSGYWAFKVGTVAVYIVALRSLQFLIGGSGQISLGHSAFMAIGAYAGGALVAAGWVGSFWSHPLAAIFCGLAGFAFGWPAVRLAGPYLALATLALALALPQLLKHPVLEKVTGGVSGLSLDAQEWTTWLGSMPAEKFGLLQCIVWGTFAIVALERALAGPAGIAWLSLRDHPTAAAATGVDVRFWKACAFGISAAMAGLAGSIHVALTNFVAPDSYGVFLSLFLLAGVAIAGTSPRAGIVAGALFLVFVPDLAEKVNKDATGLIFGAVMLACVYLHPAATALRRRLARKRMPAAPVASPAPRESKVNP